MTRKSNIIFRCLLGFGAINDYDDWKFTWWWLDETKYSTFFYLNQVYKRMLRNLINIARDHHQIKNNTTFIRDAIEMMLATTPHDPDFQFLLIKIYLYLRINLQQVNDRYKPTTVKIWQVSTYNR